MEDLVQETKKIVHVIKRENGWAVKKHGASRATKIYQNKKEAVKDARRLKRKGHDLVIHHKDGSVQKWEESEKSN